MMLCKDNYYQFLLFLVFDLSSPYAFSYSSWLSNLPSSIPKGHSIVQVGGYWSNQGHTQQVNIQSLIGDDFTVTKHNGRSVLVGLGYFLDGQERQWFKMSYGINAFYLTPTQVSGNVIQEDLFTNLSYKYSLTHYPIYAIAKSTIDTKFPKYKVTIDAGIGPNFVQASGFQEQSLDGVTIPDNIFYSHTTTTFAVTAGASIKRNQIFRSASLECGYRFFYLGQGHFSIQNTQIINTLNTGKDYANALLCAVTV